MAPLLDQHVATAPAALPTPSRAWLAVATRETAADWVAGGSIGVSSLHRSQLASMAEGDGLVVFCPAQRTDGFVEQRGFAALGLVSGTPPYTAPDGGRGAGDPQPYRRETTFLPAAFVALAALASDLRFGRVARSVPAVGAGVLELATDDFDRIAARMTARA